jgi:hypothetical protein
VDGLEEGMLYDGYYIVLPQFDACYITEDTTEEPVKATIYRQNAVQRVTIIGPLDFFMIGMTWRKALMKGAWLVLMLSAMSSCRSLETTSESISS